MAGVQSNTVKPGREFGVASELPQVPKGRQKSLLANVARVLIAPEHAQRQSVNRPLPSSHQQAKRVGLTGECPLDDLIVAKFHNSIRESDPLSFNSSLSVRPLRRKILIIEGRSRPSACSSGRYPRRFRRLD